MYVYGIPEEFKFQARKSFEKGNWIVAKWFFYEISFRKGLRFPHLWPHLVLINYEIAPSQLMSNKWRLLISLDALSFKTGIPFRLQEF